jgi:hypothetical protein
MWVGSHGRPEQALFSNVQLVSGFVFIALLLEAAATPHNPAPRSSLSSPGMERHRDLPESEEQETKLPTLEAVMSELDDSSPPPSPAGSQPKSTPQRRPRAAPGDVVDPGPGDGAGGSAERERLARGQPGLGVLADEADELRATVETIGRQGVGGSSLTHRRAAAVRVVESSKQEDGPER